MQPSYLWVVVGEHDLSTTGETDRTRSYAVDRYSSTVQYSTVQQYS